MIWFPGDREAREMSLSFFSLPRFLKKFQWGYRIQNNLNFCEARNEKVNRVRCRLYGNFFFHYLRIVKSIPCFSLTLLHEMKTKFKTWLKLIFSEDDKVNWRRFTVKFQPLFSLSHIIRNHSQIKSLSFFNSTKLKTQICRRSYEVKVNICAIASCFILFPRF